MKKFLQAAVLAMLLVLVSAPAWALGLGQLQLKSKLGEPLLAEIPVISADPAELESLQARLAAPDTFLRVGLPLTLAIALVSAWMARWLWLDGPLWPTL